MTRFLVLIGIIYAGVMMVMASQSDNHTEPGKNIQYLSYYATLSKPIELPSAQEYSADHPNVENLVAAVGETSWRYRKIFWPSLHCPDLGLNDRRPG